MKKILFKQKKKVCIFTLLSFILNHSFTISLRIYPGWLKIQNICKVGQCLLINIYTMVAPTDQSGLGSSTWHQSNSYPCHSLLLPPNSCHLFFLKMQNIVSSSAKLEIVLSDARSKIQINHNYDNLWILEKYKYNAHKVQYG